MSVITYKKCTLDLTCNEQKYTCIGKTILKFLSHGLLTELVTVCIIFLCISGTISETSGTLPTAQ